LVILSIENNILKEFEHENLISNFRRMILKLIFLIFNIKFFYINMLKFWYREDFSGTLSYNFEELQGHQICIICKETWN